MFRTCTCVVVGRAVIAQVSNLPYRRLAVGRVSSTTSTVADWKSAIQLVGNLRYGFTKAIMSEMFKLAMRVTCFLDRNPIILSHEILKPSFALRADLELGSGSHRSLRFGTAGHGPTQ